MVQPRKIPTSFWKGGPQKGSARKEWSGRNTLPTRPGRAPSPRLGKEDPSYMRKRDEGGLIGTPLGAVLLLNFFLLPFNVNIVQDCQLHLACP